MIADRAASGGGDREARPGVRVSGGLGSRLLLVAFLVLAAYFSVSIAAMMVAGYRLEREAAALRGDIAELEADHRALLRREAALHGDDAVERLAREQLGMVRPGETPVRLVRPRATPAVAPAATPTPRPISTFDRVWGEGTGRR